MAFPVETSSWHRSGEGGGGGVVYYIHTFPRGVNYRRAGGVITLVRCREIANRVGHVKLWNHRKQNGWHIKVINSFERQGFPFRAGRGGASHSHCASIFIRCVGQIAWCVFWRVLVGGFFQSWEVLLYEILEKKRRREGKRGEEWERIEKYGTCVRFIIRREKLLSFASYVYLLLCVLALVAGNFCQTDNLEITVFIGIWFTRRVVVLYCNLLHGCCRH